jgi:hypothetical protein
MANLTQKYTNPFADVEISPVQIGGQDISSKIAVRVKDDDGNWSITPAILSSDYKLIQNSIAKDVSADIMSRSGLQWSELKTLWDGKKFCQYHITNDPIVEINGGNESSHPIKVGLMVRNSYDGSGVFGLEVFACNVVCANQYHDRNRFGYFAIRHDNMKEFELQDALQNLSTGVQNVIAAAPIFNRMRETPLTVEHLIETKKKTTIPKSMWCDVIEQLALESRTVFGLYQALTFVASHNVQGFNAIGVGESISKVLLK